MVVTALHDSAGKLRGYAKVTQDLTQLKQAEAMEFARHNINDLSLFWPMNCATLSLRSAVPFHLMMAVNQTDDQTHRLSKSSTGKVVS